MKIRMVLDKGAFFYIDPHGNVVAHVHPVFAMEVTRSLIENGYSVVEATGVIEGNPPKFKEEINEHGTQRQAEKG